MEGVGEAVSGDVPGFGGARKWVAVEVKAYQAFEYVVDDLDRERVDSQIGVEARRFLFDIDDESLVFRQIAFRGSLRRLGRLATGCTGGGHLAVPATGDQT